MPLVAARGGSRTNPSGPRGRGRRVVNTAQKQKRSSSLTNTKKPLTLNDRFTIVKKRGMDDLQKNRTRRRKTDADAKRKQKRNAALSKRRNNNGGNVNDNKRKPRRGPKKGKKKNPSNNPRPMKTMEELDQEMIEAKNKQ
eukprot:gb/GECH01008290.1/.p1 GENE.gb/GECH01008290.1/~~gb/GECH01008290.1/.p1  ORF type:complete len:140 (+),score=27.51 gb/GECH01008290.1/:1-420(+)